MRFLTFLLALAACNDASDLSPYASGSLALPEVEPDEEIESSRKDLSGDLSVSGEGERLTVRVDTSFGRTEVELKAPSRPDLSGIDGLTGQLSLAKDALTDEISLLVTGDDGPRYLLETVDSTVLTDSAFGPTFVQVGNDLGRVPVGLDHVRLYSALFQTDDGELEVFPGEPVEATIDGLSYRIVLIASWVRERSEDQVSNCYQLDDVLAYEVLRVEPGTADTTPLTRPESEPIDGASCAP